MERNSDCKNQPLRRRDVSMQALRHVSFPSGGQVKKYCGPLHAHSHLMELLIGSSLQQPASLIDLHGEDFLDSTDYHHLAFSGAS